MPKLQMLHFHLFTVKHANVLKKDLRLALDYLKNRITFAQDDYTNDLFRKTHTF